MVADHPGQQVLQCSQRSPIDVRALLSANRRASQPVEHPQGQLQRKAGRTAGKATAGYGNATSGNHLINADFPPRPGVKLVENPALTGTVGVRKSSYTTANARTRRSTAKRRRRRMPASNDWIGRRRPPMPQAAALWILWTSPSDRPAPCGTWGQPVDNASALTTACPHSRASRPQIPQRQQQNFLTKEKTYTGQTGSTG